MGAVRTQGANSSRQFQTEKQSASLDGIRRELAAPKINHRPFPFRCRKPKHGCESSIDCLRVRFRRLIVAGCLANHRQAFFKRAGFPLDGGIVAKEGKFHFESFGSPMSTIPRSIERGEEYWCSPGKRCWTSL